MQYIKVKLKHPPKNSLFLGDIVNVTADSILKELEEITLTNNKDIKCDIHKKQSKGTITISLKDDNEKSLQLTDFCCDKFKSKIKF